VPSDSKENIYVPFYLGLLPAGPARAIGFILTDPPYLVGYKDRSGRTLAEDNTNEWLQPACNEMYRVLKDNSLMVSFYGWDRADQFINALFLEAYREALCVELEKVFAPDEQISLLIWTEESVRVACSEDKPTDEEVMLLLETIGSVDMECYREEGVTNAGLREVLESVREEAYQNRRVAVPAFVLERVLKKLERGLVQEEGVAWENGQQTPAAFELAWHYIGR